MTDKEVGSLWTDHYCPPGHTYSANGMSREQSARIRIIRLIHKVVQERAQNYSNLTRDSVASIYQVLHEFDIPEEEFDESRYDPARFT